MAQALASDVPSDVAFQRDDVFALGLGGTGVQEYAPSGQLQQTIPTPGTSIAECFDPSGKHLIVPGVGLFDRSGNLLPSNWASITNAGRCAADGLGHVYVSISNGTSPYDGPFTVTKYDIAGIVVQTMNIGPVSGLGPLAIDLAPDECTMY